MKVLVIGGLHGNEPLGLGIVDRLKSRPLPGVDAMLGNPAARRSRRRFVESDLNRVFPGNPGGDLEERRAFELMKRMPRYDLVLDFHNTHCPDNDCGFVGGSDYGTLLPVASSLGLGKVIVADYDCINKYVPRCLSVEVSLDSPKCSTEHWIERIGRLAASPDVSTARRPSLYRFTYRVTREEQDRYRFKDWKAFRPVPQEDLSRLGLTGKHLPIFIDDEYTPYNYAGLVAPLG